MTNRCANCRHWAPLFRDRNFMGKCIAPTRPDDRCTDRTDTCVLHEAQANDNIVQGLKIREYLD